eukprot:75748-Heterocapsa_arctica.AAC.1
MCIRDRCLLRMRLSAVPGDAVVLLSAMSPEAPPAYVRAVAARGARRSILAVFRVTDKVPTAVLHGRAP